MELYLETNFLLEVSLEQEESEPATAIVEIAKGRNWDVLIPAYCYAEARNAMASKAGSISDLIALGEKHYRELTRSASLGSEAETLSEALVAMGGVRDNLRGRLRQTIEQSLNESAVLPTTGDVISNGLDLESAFDLARSDALVASTILEHLQSSKPPVSCFVTRDGKDFLDPDVNSRFEAQGCKVIVGFDNALQYLTSLENDGIADEQGAVV